MPEADQPREQPSPGAGTSPHSDSREPRQGFTDWQLKALGLLAVVVTCGLVVYLFENVSRLETQNARFLICLLVSLLLAIFFFVWWPARYELDKVPGLNLPVRVAGPVALWLILLLLLWQLMPREDAPLKAFAPVNAPGGKLLYHHGTELVREDGRPLEFDLIEDRAETGKLAKILVQFEPGEDVIRARLHVPFHRPLAVSLKRTETTFDASQLQYGGQ